MSDKPSDQDRLEHMLEAIERIFRFAEGLSQEDFPKNEMAQFAIIKNIEIIGETAYNVSKELKRAYPDTEWRKIIAFRHILAHDYYKINPQIVWNAIEHKLDGLRVELEDMMKSI